MVQIDFSVGNKFKTHWVMFGWRSLFDDHREIVYGNGGVSTLACCNPPITSKAVRTLICRRTCLERNDEEVVDAETLYSAHTRDQRGSVSQATELAGVYVLRRRFTLRAWSSGRLEVSDQQGQAPLYCHLSTACITGMGEGKI